MADADVIIIGSGIGGLSCAAILARYGFDVLVCESHSIAGGAAHGFERNGFRFDSGPSLFSGLSTPSPNPLRQVLDAIEVTLPCAQYETWGCFLPEGNFDTRVGAEQFCEVLHKLRGDQAVSEWRNLQRVMEPYAQAAIALPPAALRYDWGAAITVGQFLPSLARHGLAMGKLSGSFDRILREAVTDPFIQNWLNLLCFLLSGLPASDTSAAEMAFMFADWYRPNVKLDYPIGGSGALVDAIAQGFERLGGKLRLNAHVDRIVVEGNRAVGIQLRNGEELRARRAVVSNASVWDTLKLLPPDALPERDRRQRQATPHCPSFMHLHLGIDATGLPPDLACHHIIVNDWDVGITAAQNVILVSIPSLIDPSVAPSGKHAIHVYTPGNEPYELWQNLDRGVPERYRRSSAYARQKAERAEVMWKAIERVIPDVRSRCEVELVGTPLTHERYLRRDRGTYGPAISAAKGFFPTGTTPISGLLCCGDSTFPGIGLPAVAASGIIAANSIATVSQHQVLLKDLGF